LLPVTTSSLIFFGQKDFKEIVILICSGALRTSATRGAPTVLAVKCRVKIVRYKLLQEKKKKKTICNSAGIYAHFNKIYI
jgi:hypothetical protein